MARPSNRSNILDAAVRVIQRDGVTAVTFDAVSDEADMTRGGMIYHFPTRDHLVAAIHQHVVDHWEADLVAELGEDPETSTESQRAAAYVRVNARSVSRTELQLMLEAAGDPALQQPWDDVVRRWVPTADGTPREQALRRICMAADGMWLGQAVSGIPMNPGITAAALLADIAAIDDPD